MAFRASGGNGRREQLLRIGIDAFSTRDYADVSVESVAEAAGIAKGLLYYYFPSKHAFFVATVQAISDEMEASTDADPGLPPEERLKEGLRANIDYAERHALAYRTILRGGGSGDPAVGRIVEQRRERGVRRVLEGLEIDRPRPALLVSLRGWIGYFEESVLAWLGNEGLSGDELLDLLMRALGSALRDAQAVDPSVDLGSARGEGPARV